ncbi:MAG: ASCH domain-containing protein [Burkholderiaceae bacterium]|nr:ASCH domain-containing protein [Burkholderiaceae bacterium]
MLPCLSIRQPWASLILKAGKDIENRDWPTKRRGRVLIHASKGMTRDEHEDAIAFAVDAIRARPKADAKTTTLRELGFAFDDLQRGGIVGSVEIVDCVEFSDSPWFVGGYGFVLRDPRPLPFVPWKGALGFFGVPRAALVAATPDVI